MSYVNAVQHESNQNYLYKKSMEPLSRKEEYSVAVEAFNGNRKARETLFLSNLRFAIQQAGKYTGIGIETEDLYSVAACGLLDAVNNYNPEKGASLCTYSARYIKNAVFNAANKCGARQYLTDSENKKLVTVKKAFKEASIYYEEREEQLEAVVEATDIPRETVEDLLYCSEFAVSGETETGTGKLELFDLFAEKRNCSPEDYAVESCMKDEVLRQLYTMEREERHVFMLANGLGCKNAFPHSLTEIAKETGRSRQWVYYKLNAAKKHLSEKMKDWM